MGTADYAGLTAHYLDSGEGPAVVMLHAGGSAGRQWRKVAGFLGGYRTIAPDLIGFGETPPWPCPEELTHDQQAGLVQAVMDDAGIEAAHLVGHSYGGATALRLVLAAPDRVTSLALIEPIAMPLLREAGEADLWEYYRDFAQAFIRRGRAGDHEGAWRAFIDERNGEGTWDRLDEGRRAGFLAQTAQSIAGFISNLNAATTLADCRSLAVPTIAVHGAETTAPERRVTEILADAILDCSLHVVPGAGHMSPLTHPEPVAEILLRHLLAAAA